MTMSVTDVTGRLTLVTAGMLVADVSVTVVSPDVVTILVRSGLTSSGLYANVGRGLWSESSVGLGVLDDVVDVNSSYDTRHVISQRLHT